MKRMKQRGGRAMVSDKARKVCEREGKQEEEKKGTSEKGGVVGGDGPDLGTG